MTGAQIRVLGRRNSANVQKVMWTLGELGLDYVRDDVGGSFGYPDDYPNPNHVVPTLLDGDVTVWESGACVRHREKGRASRASQKSPDAGPGWFRRARGNRRLQTH